MIDTCDPAIATWADNGHSFIIHDVKEFSKVSIEGTVALGRQR